jgi:hypothetical protein
MKAWMMALALAWGIGRAEALARAPGDEVAAASWLATGTVDFDDPENPEVSGRVSLQEAVLMAPLAGWERGGWTVAVGAWAGWTRLDFAGHPELDAEDLYGLAAFAALSRPVSGGWGASLLAMPGFTSDFRSGRTGEGKLLLHGTVDYPFGERWTARVGLAYDTAYGEPRLYPVGGMVWRPAEQISVNLVMPSPFVSWTPTDRWGVFVLMQPAGDRWIVDDDEAGEQVFVIESWRAAAGVEWRVAGPAWLRLSGGVDFDRRWEARSGGRVLLEDDVDDTWQVSAAIVVY